MSQGSKDSPLRTEMLDDTGWIDLTTSAGWTVYRKTAYRVKNGVLYMKGYVSRITPAASDLTICTLPLHLVQSLDTVYGRGWSGGAGGAAIYIQVNGVVRTAYTTAGHVDFFLDPICFPLEQSIK